MTDDNRPTAAEIVLGMVLAAAIAWGLSELAVWIATRG